MIASWLQIGQIWMHEHRHSYRRIIELDDERVTYVTDSGRVWSCGRPHFVRRCPHKPTEEDIERINSYNK